MRLETVMAAAPDYTDPYAPDWKSTALVCCTRCGTTYRENEIWWNPDATLWVCKHWPNCEGAGLGFAIFHHNGNCPVHSKQD
jgi:hypothetical protein